MGFVENIPYLLCRMVTTNSEWRQREYTKCEGTAVTFTALLVHDLNKQIPCLGQLLALVKALTARTSKASSTSAGSVCKFTTQCKIQRIV